MKRAARVARAYATASSALPRAPDDPTAPARHAPSDGRTGGTPPTPFGDGKSAGLPGKLDSRHPVSHWSAVGPRGAGIRRSRSAANRAPRSPSSRPSRTVPRRAGWPGSGRGVGGAAAPDAVHLPAPALGRLPPCRTPPSTTPRSSDAWNGPWPATTGSPSA